jgi:hypothetical protein
MSALELKIYAILKELEMEFKHIIYHTSVAFILQSI